MSEIYTLTATELKTLAEKAIAAKSNAYCPYSNFRVGACVLVASSPAPNTISHPSNYHPGSNVEIASTPVGVCAERCALGPLIASYTRPTMPIIRAVAVSSDITPGASPCGMCRQFMREFCENEMPIYMFGREDDWEKYEMRTMGELLPMSFGKGDMNPVKKATVGGGEKKSLSVKDGAAIVQATQF